MTEYSSFTSNNILKIFILFVYLCMKVISFALNFLYFRVLALLLWKSFCISYVLALNFKHSRQKQKQWTYHYHYLLKEALTVLLHWNIYCMEAISKDNHAKSVAKKNSVDKTNLSVSHSVMSSSLKPHALQYFPVHHQLQDPAHVHQVSDAIQPSHPLSSPSPPASSLSQYQDLF